MEYDNYITLFGRIFGLILIYIQKRWQTRLSDRTAYFAEYSNPGYAGIYKRKTV